MKINKPIVSIIIVNWNGEKILSVCIDSILKQTYENYEIIIIDNNSTDDSVKIINKYKDNRIKLFELPVNLGFAGGNNFGLKKAKGEFYFLINTDVILLNKITIEMLVEYFNKSEQKKIGAVYPLIMLDEKKINSLGTYLLPDFHPMNLGFNKDVSQLDLLKNSEKLIGFYGACVLINKEMINEIGLFNEEYYLYHEETDLCIRGKLKNWNYELYSELKVLHLHSYSSKELSLKKIFYCERNRLFNLIKYKGFIYFFKTLFFTLNRYTSNGENLHTKIVKKISLFNKIKIILTIFIAYISVIFYLDTLLRYKGNKLK